MIRFPTAKKPSTPIGPTLRARGGMDARIRLALELMHQQCWRTLTVGEVAGRFRLSASRFEHLFKLGRGRSFKMELRDIRLRLAETLLKSGTLRVKEIASLCGYSSVPTFSKMFRERFGQPPSSFRHSYFG